MKTHSCSGALVCAFFFASILTLLGQGSLTPPGTPAPTMKSLDQIEPRRPINSTNTPGDATNQFIINQPGSYYLTGNVSVPAGKDGISVQANDVTVDLSGFSLTGTAPRVGVIVGTFSRVTVKNGNLSGWAKGVGRRQCAGTFFQSLDPW